MAFNTAGKQGKPFLKKDKFSIFLKLTVVNTICDHVEEVQ